MKVNKLYIILTLVLSFTLNACNEEFLETKPANSVDAASVFADTKSAAAAINGIYRAMIRRYQDSQGHSGYPAHLLIIDILGDDTVLSTTSNTWHRPEQQWVSHRSETGTMPAFGFDLFYRIISNANNIIAGIDNAVGTQDEKNAIKGEALGLRALAYFNLVQMYGKRYDAAAKPNNQLGVSMPLEPTSEGLARSTVEEVYTQINKDLADASSIMKSSRINKSHININVIKGLHARVALVQQNWTNAAQFAAEAKAGIALMSAAQYTDGFADITNPEWMWGFDHIEDQSEFFGGYHSYISCNFNSSVIRTCPRAINKLVYDAIPATDVRSQMWAKAPNLASTVTPPGGVKPAYMVQKFRLPGVPSTSTMGDIPYMRSGEMYLIEAEAKARLNDNEGAQKVLFDLVKTRDAAAVQSTKTGQDLIDEIIFNRRIELWGEGHRWFDLKRLNQPVNRMGANHISANVLFFEKAADDTAWEFLIPRRELETNSLSVQNPL